MKLLSQLDEPVKTCLMQVWQDDDLTNMGELNQEELLKKVTPPSKLRTTPSRLPREDSNGVTPKKDTRRVQ